MIYTGKRTWLELLRLWPGFILSLPFRGLRVIHRRHLRRLLNVYHDLIFFICGMHHDASGSVRRRRGIRTKLG